MIYLQKVLTRHLAWLSGNGGSRADLRGAHLSKANLFEANLSKASLSEADLSWADLYTANLREADLSGANLFEARLYTANLSRADLRGANLSKTNLYGANLSKANLSGADLRGANLSRVNLREADLSGADLFEAKLPAFQIPQEGPLVAWKRVYGGICKLQVIGARTASLVGRKCRTEEAIVLECIPPGPKTSLRSNDFVYTEGQRVTPTRPYDPDIRIECASGIHFFLTREEAEAY